MAGAVALPFVDIKNNRFAAIENPKKDQNHLVEYTKSANGAFRVFQLCERVCKAAMLVLNSIGSAFSSVLEKVAEKFSTAWAMMAIPRLPQVTRDAITAVKNWTKPPEGAIPSASYDTVQKIHDIADAAATWGYAASVLGLPTKDIADVPNLVCDVSDVLTNTSDISNAREHLKQIDANNPAQAPIARRFTDTITHGMIKTLKAVVSVFGYVMGLLGMVFATQFLPTALLVLMGLTTVTAAISAAIFKDKAPYELVDFHKIRNPEVLVNGRAVF